MDNGNRYLKDFFLDTDCDSYPTTIYVYIYIYRSRYFICIVWYSGEFRANFARIYGSNEIYILNYLLEIVAPVQFSCVQ